MLSQRLGLEDRHRPTSPDRLSSRAELKARAVESSSIVSGPEPWPQELRQAKKKFSEVVQQRLKNSSELVSASTTQLLCSCSALPQTGTCHRSRFVIKPVLQIASTK